MIATHNLKTYSGETYALTHEDKRAVDKAMEEGKTFVRFGPVTADRLPKYNVAIKNISSMPPITRTEADAPILKNALPRGEVKFDPNGPGYKSFLKAREKLINKMRMRHEGKDEPARSQENA